MKLLGLVLPLFVAASSGAVQTPVTAQSRAGFMVGCWEQTRGTSVIREEWRAVSPDFLIGTSTTTKNGVVSEFEFLRVESKDGVVAYVAQPGGVPPTRFTLDPASSAGELVFANPQHDFPKRIVYKKISDTAVTAWIDGGEGTRKIEFPYTRCSVAIR